MRILLFLEDYYLGGVDTFVINLINSWPNKKDQIILICNRQHTGLDFIQMSLTRPCTLIKHNIKIFTSFFELKSEKFYDRLTVLLLKLSAPIIRYIFFIYNIFALKKLLLKNSPDRLMVINGGYPGGDSCRAACISWGLFSKKPLGIHNYHGIVLSPGWHIFIQEYILDKISSYFTKCYITVSQAAAKTMLHRKTINLKKMPLFIYNGVSFSNNGSILCKSNITKELAIPGKSYICLMLGGYHFHKNFDKGHDFVFKAMREVLKQIPDTHLIICGYGSNEDKDRVRNLAKTHKLDNKIHILGFRYNISDYLKIADIALVGSQTFESFCLAGIEAMAHSIPVVATNVGAIPETIVNNEGGYCVDKEDKDSYAKYIISLLKNKDLRIKQGKKGYEKYNQYFTASRMASKYAKVICS